MYEGCGLTDKLEKKGDKESAEVHDKWSQRGEGEG